MCKELTWNELADIYDKQTGRTARIQPLEKVFKWAESRKDLFVLTKSGGLTLAEKPHLFHTMQPKMDKN